MAAASLPLAGAAAASAETLTDIADAVLEAMPPAAGTYVPPIEHHAPGRTSELLADWAQAHTDALGIPRPAMQAYGHAALVTQAANPGCNISWTTLAGIGAIESWHGTYEGAQILEDGTVDPPIRGVKLDGRPGLADIPDTDNGELDGDPEHDRAMGPMQFIPETWRLFGTDGNGNGIADPDNIDDAAMSAARYLCAAGGNLGTPEGWRKAILAYNQSEEYLLDVRDAAWRYAADVYVPEPAPPEPAPEPPAEGELPPPAEGDAPLPEGELPPPVEGEAPPPVELPTDELAAEELPPVDAQLPPVEDELPPAEGELPPPAEELVHHEHELDGPAPDEFEAFDEREAADERPAFPGDEFPGDEFPEDAFPEGEIDDADLELLRQFAEQYGDEFAPHDDADGEAGSETDRDRHPAERPAGQRVPDVLAKLAAQIWAFLAKLGINGEPQGGA